MGTSAAQTGSAADTGAGRRLPLLDVLRGTAILGTLATNVWIFASPGSEGALLSSDHSMGAVAALRGDLSAGTLAEAVFRFAANGKFLAMLTLLFGVGLAIQFRSAARRGERWPGSYKWRALFLFCEGALHFTLVFAWDVLMGYAVVAMITAWLLTRSERVQGVVMWSAAAVHLAVMALLTAALVAEEPAAAAPPTGAPADIVALYAHGSYLDQIAFRLSNIGELRSEPILSFALLLFLFLLGTRLFRAGAFGDGTAGRRIRRRLLGWGLGIGLPLNVLATAGGAQLFLVDRYVAAPVLALGLVGLVGVLLDRERRPGIVVHSVSSLGRTALTGYVLQNAICMLACYGIGLGLTTRLAGTGPWWVLGLWAAVSLLLLVAAPLWLRRFRHGPLEAVQKAVLARVPARRG